MVHYTWWFGSGFLGYCDFFGEKLAWALGITSPKYYYEIEDFKRSQEEEKQKKERMGVEAGAGWTAPPPNPQPIVTSQLSTSNLAPIPSAAAATQNGDSPTATQNDDSPTAKSAESVDFDPGSADAKTN